MAGLVTAVSGTVAAAATGVPLVSGPWTVVFGTTGNDVINESTHTGNFRIYGFAGKDVLTGGKGDNVLIGDGHCPPGTTKEKTIMTIPAPPGNPENNADAYCDDNWIPGDPGDKLTGGSGNNVLIGGGGPNTMTGGAGHNYFQDGPSNDTIVGGPSGDVINATNGPSTITAGTGPNVIDTAGPGISTVTCTGHLDIVYANTNDVVHHCALVFYQFHGRNHRVSWHRIGHRAHATSKHERSARSHL